MLGKYVVNSDVLERLQYKYFRVGKLVNRVPWKTINKRFLLKFNPKIYDDLSTQN